ncbi:MULTISPECIES: LysE family translocator [Legionella]|uniref:LysE family translocator n=1 Tax=Legionella TaxID=445 RepID=UPI00095B4AB5|nr:MULTISPECIES: LysE family translocator [Legionella]MBN9228256.1 LysE family translocator [Legionella steelei]OJW09503.1 MAG: lysine transporter LysE [Legionella sp. 39-23]
MTLLLAMFSFSLVMSITPGPVNMIILSSGINYGVKRTIPYVSGATIGFTFLLIFIGFGFAQFINAYPFFLTYLAIAGSSYIIYMGYKIAFSKPELEVTKKDTPKFYEGFLLQWINPKAWIACVSGASIFSSANNHDPFLTFTLIYFIVCYLSLGIWAVLGDKVSYLLKDHTRLRQFNFIMGLLLMLTAGYLCFGQINY